MYVSEISFYNRMLKILNSIYFVIQSFYFILYQYRLYLKKNKNCTENLNVDFLK